MRANSEWINKYLTHKTDPTKDFLDPQQPQFAYLYSQVHNPAIYCKDYFFKITFFSIRNSHFSIKYIDRCCNKNMEHLVKSKLFLHCYEGIRG